MKVGLRLAVPEGIRTFWRTLPLYQQGLVLLTALLLMDLVVAAYGFMPQMERLQQLESENASGDRQAPLVQASQNDDAALARAAVRYADALAQWPEDGRLAEIWSEMTEYAQVAGVVLESLQPLPAVHQDDLTVLPLSLRLSGRYIEICRFLQLLRYSPRHSGLVALRLAAPDKLDGGLLLLDMTLNAYSSTTLQSFGLTRQLPDQSARPGLLEAALRVVDSGQQDPFDWRSSATRPADHRVIQSLAQHDLHRLVMRGVLRGLEESWALIAPPEGRAQVVKLGDRLGKQAGQVMQISAEGVRVALPLAEGQSARHEWLLLKPPAMQAIVSSPQGENHD